jgi:class 3 adenylate cyclase
VSPLRPRTFRGRLLRDLLVLVGGFFLVTLVAIGLLATRQVEQAVAGTIARSRRAFAEQDRQRQDELRSYGDRFALSNRLPAELDAVLQGGGGSTYLLETARYEMKLANIPNALAAFTGPDGTPIAAILDGREMRDPGAGVPAPLVRRVLERGDTAANGYHLLGGRLFTVHVVPLLVFGNPVGSLTLGFPVDDAVARHLGEGVGAEVCFVAGSRCVASTAGVARTAALARMAGMAGHRSGERVSWNGHAYSLAANPVSVDSETPVWWVIAVPLDDVISPFRRLAVASFTTGLLALLAALALGATASRRLTRPVQALSAATARVRAGDLSARVPVEEDDELGALSEAFNAMTHGLMLKDRYQAALIKTNSPEIAAELVKGTDIAPGGENRCVTILFADIRGFTTLTEGMEPQEVIAIVNGFLERASAAVAGEGGLVDKYLGDQIMALFGAPMERGDDAVRAARAAVAIQQGVAAFSAERQARGEPPIQVGIGINTGPTVAGFVGSPERLNYTVLGQSVNVAARLCSIAAPGETLASADTRARLGDAVRLSAGGSRSLKGLSQPVEVFRIEGFAGEHPPVADDASPSSAEPTRAGAMATAVATALGLAMLAAASPAVAQTLPTLEQAGIRYTSLSGWLQITPSGRLDVTGYAGRRAPSWLVPTTDAFVAPRASVFVDVFAGSRLYARGEARADRGEEPAPRPIQARIEQAFVRWTPFRAVDAGIQAGKFVSPFGGYPQRHNDPGDAFIRAPLPYEYRTVICAGIAPGSPAGFLTWRDKPDIFRAIGSPVVWGVPYQAGVMASGVLRGVSARFAVMNSAPSSPPGDWNPRLGRPQHPSVVAAVGMQVVPELRLGLSYDRGPYMRRRVQDLPADDPWYEYDQELWGAEAVLARGPLETHAELFLDRWEVPRMHNDPRDVSYTVESRLKLGPGRYVAARYGAIRFDDVSNEASPTPAYVTWDYPAQRVELAAGLATGRNTQLRAQYLWNTGGDLHGGTSGLAAVQWAWSF